MNKNWINKQVWDSEYRDGVSSFLNFAFRNASCPHVLPCPCNECLNCKLKTRDVMQAHLLQKGFLRSYVKWLCHGESSDPSSAGPSSVSVEQEMQGCEVDEAGGFGIDNMNDLLRDAFGLLSFPNIDEFRAEQQGRGESSNAAGETDTPDGETDAAVGQTDAAVGGTTARPVGASGARLNADSFFKLVEEAGAELYEGCTSHSRLSFIIRLFHLKCLGGWTGKSLTMLLELLNEAFPNLKLPGSYQKIKHYLKSFGLIYVKIGVCLNECTLYWGDKKDQQACHKCGASKWERKPENGSKGKLARILRYFPLIPRLQRLFMSIKTSSSMRWHREGRKDDGCKRHPADSKAWRKLDELDPDFANDPRNVRLGLASDGFNPYRMLNNTYSIWPVILIPYNLPPDLCMKQPSLIMSMIIPGPKSPGNNIDVYMQPLIAELQQLWVGVETYDATSKETFNMRAALLWTVNDYPAMAVLSGRSTKGRFACPYCGTSTCSRWLTHGKKFCYMGHRRWLDLSHRFRQQKQSFDGTVEDRTAPVPMSGSEILAYLESRDFSVGESSSSRRTAGSKRRRVEQDTTDAELDEEGEDPVDAAAWKRKSIFYELPYWQFLLVRHIIDFMHTEKNIAENCIATLLNEKGKSKDNYKARLDLQQMNIRHGLHPYEEDGRMKTRPACYSMTKKEKELFLQVFRKLKVPDGYCSNLSKAVNMKDHRLQGLKSHDYHIIMQDLLPVALSCSMPKEVTAVMIELCSLLKALCSKDLREEEMESLQQRAALTLCSMEKIFPPSFFTVMVHLLIHLPEEVALAGPVHYRWMYPIERCLFTLKKYVTNKAHPEGSIAEGHLSEETATFFSLFLEGPETRINRPLRNPDQPDGNDSCFLFNTGGTPVGATEYVVFDDRTLVQAHRYVLFHHEAVNQYCDTFFREVRQAYRPRRYRSHELDKIMNERFPSWFQQRVARNEAPVSDAIKWLAKGPLKQGKSYKGMIHNGIRYITKQSEQHKRSQNSGIVVCSKTRTYNQGQSSSSDMDTDYYGILTDIIELDYHSRFKVVLFRGDWPDPTEGKGTITNGFGIKFVNFTKLIHTGKEIVHEPFVFPSQAQQCFYVEDPRDNHWHAAIKIRPRSVFALGYDDEDDNSARCVPFTPQQLDDAGLDNFFNQNVVRADTTDDIELDK